LLAERLRAKRRGAAGTTWHADETYIRVNGRWCYLYRATDRDGDLIDARLSATRDTDAARRFFRQALASAGKAPAQVTTDGHDAYPRASREGLGQSVRHRTSRYKNNRIEQDHRGIEQRYYLLRGFGSFASAARFCSAFEELRQYFRAVSQGGERVSLAEQRCRYQERWAAVMGELASRLTAAPAGLMPPATRVDNARHPSSDAAYASAFSWRNVVPRSRRSHSGGVRSARSSCARNAFQGNGVPAAATASISRNAPDASG
jgi:transposase-like protein